MSDAERGRAPGIDAATRQGIIERDREICENLKAFYSPDCLVLLSALATLQNIALIVTQTHPPLGAPLAHLSADAVGAVASISTRTRTQVTNDILTIARARLVVVKP